MRAPGSAEPSRDHRRSTRRDGNAEPVVTHPQRVRRTTLIESVERTTTRLGRSHRRVEISQPHATVLRSAPDVGAARGRALGSDAARTPDDPIAGAMRGQRIATLPLPDPIDLELLTDEVVAKLDDRLTAHRERFGRAF